MRKFISAIPPQEVTHNFTTAINAALVPFSGFRVYMTDSEKAGRSMAEDREGYVRLISRIANQFPDALSRSDAPDDPATACRRAGLSPPALADKRTPRCGTLPLDQDSTAMGGS